MPGCLRRYLGQGWGGSGREGGQERKEEDIGKEGGWESRGRGMDDGGQDKAGGGGGGE